MLVQLAQYGWHVWPEFSSGLLLLLRVLESTHCGRYRPNCPDDAARPFWRRCDRHSTYYILLLLYYITYSRLCAAHQLSSVCAQSSFLPSTEHLRNEPTFKKSPAYFKPFFEALPTDRFQWFFVMRGLMPRPQWFDSLLRPKRPGKAVPRYRMHQVAVRRSESPTRNFGLELTPPHFPGGNETFKKRGWCALRFTIHDDTTGDSKQKRKKNGKNCMIYFIFYSFSFHLSIAMLLILLECNM